MAFFGFGTAVDPVSNLTVSLYEFRYSENQAIEAFLLGLTRCLIFYLKIF